MGTEIFRVYKLTLTRFVPRGNFEVYPISWFMLTPPEISRRSVLFRERFDHST
jgi:hypothetical protein